jgi:hypothetical protein
MPARSFFGQTYTSLWSEAEASRSPVRFRCALDRDGETETGRNWPLPIEQPESEVRIHFAPPFSPSCFALFGKSLEIRACAREVSFAEPFVIGTSGSLVRRTDRALTRLEPDSEVVPHRVRLFGPRKLGLSSEQGRAEMTIGQPPPRWRLGSLAALFGE